MSELVTGACVTTMDCVQKWDETEICSLCEDVVHFSKNSDYRDLSNSLKSLREQCGKSECGCNNNGSPQQSLRLLLKLKLCDTLIDYSVGLSLINNYNNVGHEPHCQAALERLTRRSLNSSSSTGRDLFLDQIWNCQGLRTFEIDIIEEFIQFYIRRVEKEMFVVYDKSLKNMTSWEDNQFEKYVFWSSKSAKIFTTITSLLNSCLLRIVGASDQYKHSVQVVKQFVDRVKSECVRNKKDFVLLYPYEYHSLVLLLDISPEIYPETPDNTGSVGLETVVEFVKQNLRTKPVQTICLLSHFPEWVPYIKQG